MAVGRVVREDCLSLSLTLVFPSCHSAPLLSYRRSNWAQLSLASAGGASSRSSTLYLVEEEAGTSGWLASEEEVGGVGPGQQWEPTWNKSPGKASAQGTRSAGCGPSPACLSI